MKTLIACIAGVLFFLFVWGFLAWGQNPSYDSSVTVDQFKTLLNERGLQVCSVAGMNIDTTKTPGLLDAKKAAVSYHCDADANPMKIAILKFDSEASRNAAQQRIASTHRGGFGPHAAYTYGPYVVTVQGNRGIADQVLLSKILTEANANL